MNKWPHAVLPITALEIQKYVQDEEWQRVRLSLKGQTTQRKLVTLDAWRSLKLTTHGQELPRDRQVQIDNYINALKRGGLLNSNLEVMK